jgi:hypothetical protein
MALLTLSDALYGASAMAVNELNHIHSPKIQLQKLISSLLKNAVKEQKAVLKLYITRTDARL